MNASFIHEAAKTAREKKTAFTQFAIFWTRDIAVAKTIFAAHVTAQKKFMTQEIRADKNVSCDQMLSNIEYCRAC